MSLHSLPTELIRQVCAYLPPPSHLYLALSSKRLLWASNEILSAHRNHHARHQICSDRDDVSFRPLLKILQHKPDIAWHIRSLEVWHQEPPLLSETDGDYAQIYKFCHSLFSTWISDSSVEFTTSDLERLQLLVCTKCPRLQSIKFVSFADAPADDDLENGGNWRDEVLNDRTRSYPHNYFSCAVRMCADRIGKFPWPCCFASLRQVSIINRERTHIQISNILPLFLLPAIKTLYLCGLTGFGEYDHYGFGDYGESVLYERSTVEHLFIDQPSAPSFEDGIDDLVRMPRRLKTLVLSDCGSHTLSLHNLFLHHKTSLETLLALPGMRDEYIIPMPGSLITSLPCTSKLHVVTIDVLDFNLDFPACWPMPRSSSVEVLVVQPRVGSSYSSDELVKVSNGLTEHMGKEQFPRLTAIYMDKVAKNLDRQGREATAALDAYADLNDFCKVQDILLYGFDHIGSTDAYIACLCNGTFDLALE